MENSGLSVADFMAMSKTNDGFGSGIGWLILILLFFFFFSGNGLFGRDSAQGLTLTNLERDTLNGQKTIEASILTTSCNTQKEVLNGNYATLLGFKDQQAQMAQCCCDIKSTIIQENTATRELINQHYINELADKLAVARSSINNYEQSQYLLQAMGYVPYNRCGCPNVM